MEKKYGYSYSTHALIIRKEVDGIRITVAAELPQNLNAYDGETLDLVLDILTDMADEFPQDNDPET